jgi:hypothetical protein
MLYSIIIIIIIIIIICCVTHAGPSPLFQCDTHTAAHRSLSISYNITWQYDHMDPDCLYKLRDERLGSSLMKPPEFLFSIFPRKPKKKSSFFF